MAKKEENKDLLENPEVIQEKLVSVEGWLEQNPKLAIGIVSRHLLLIIGGYFGISLLQWQSRYD
ncbi:MAG: hypothetical protein U5K54_10230 [Cytophagales bacterium]|nr:hypothetical protein [Cytophagales bacterium]